MAALNTQLPDDLKATLDARAAQEQRTIKSVVIRALTKYLEAQ